ncbi:polyprotein [Rhynchospora pubera]|uniref:Polyprotein n=1 Tax=Rhynchospora pubera TaxID=906938 RepID=A0AAV8HMC2_9POAL|nr:polyprotein [Rhynchospora pubera]
MGKDLGEMQNLTKGKAPEEPILEEADSDDEAIENHIQRQNGVVIKMLTDRNEYISTQVPDPKKGKRVLNRLYNIELTMEILGVEKFKIQAILDTGATVCCVDQNAVPKEALEPSAYPIQINGVNSSQIANQKFKGGMMDIEENCFRIPFTYAFPMEQRDGIQMLIGCNFIRAMQGGLKIEGQMVTFYKNITTIATKVDAEIAASAAIEELELSELEYFEIQRITAYFCGEESQKFKERFKPLLTRLR